MAEINGWIKLHRKITDHWLWSDKPFSKGQAFADLVMKANFSGGEKLIKGKLVKYKRGDLLRSELALSADWGWSRGKVKRFLKMLEDERMIVQHTVQVTSVITICNYEDYQKKENKADTKQTSDEHQTNIRQDTGKEVKEVKEVERENSAREEDLVVALIEPPPKLIALFERVCGTSTVLVTWLNDCGYLPDWIEHALIKTEEKGARRPIPYCKGILEEIQKDGGLKENVGSGSSRGTQGSRTYGSNGAAEQKPGYEPGKFADWD